MTHQLSVLAAPWKTCRKRYLPSMTTLGTLALPNTTLSKKRQKALKKENNKSLQVVSQKKTSVLSTRLRRSSVLVISGQPVSLIRSPIRMSSLQSSLFRGPRLNQTWTCLSKNSAYFCLLTILSSSNSTKPSWTTNTCT
jgi:hypothetical protein